MDIKICVFCGNVWDDVMVCPECNEYKGLMPLAEGIKYDGLDPEDYAEFLAMEGN